MAETPSAENNNAGSEPASRVGLPVLPHSGKVDQMRREALSAGASSAAQAGLGQALPGSDGVNPRPQGQATTGDESAVPSEPAGNPPAAAMPAGPVPGMAKKLLEAKIISVLHTIYDPEIPISIYELGLIYDIEIHDDNSVKIQMTLTSPGCPVAGSLPGEVERKIEAIPEVKSAAILLVWDPPWGRERMSEAALLQLGML